MCYTRKKWETFSLWWYVFICLVCYRKLSYFYTFFPFATYLFKWPQMKTVISAAASPMILVIKMTIIRMKTVTMSYNTNCILSMNSSLQWSCRRVSICNFWSFLGALFLLSNDEEGGKEFVDPTFILTVLLCFPSSIPGLMKCLNGNFVWLVLIFFIGSYNHG